MTVNDNKQWPFPVTPPEALREELESLYGKVQYIIDSFANRNLLEENCFTFPDGETWHATNPSEGEPEILDDYFTGFVTGLESLVAPEDVTVTEKDAEVIRAIVVLSEIVDAIKRKIYYKNSTKYDESYATNLEQAIRILSDAHWKNSSEPYELNSKVTPRMLHGFLGICTESAELLDHVISDGSDDLNIVEELGDLLFYTHQEASAIGSDMSKVKGTVIRKLKKRYPNGYTHKDAVTRNLQAERTEMQND